MCRILRVWKLKTSINTSHLLDFRPQEDLEGSGRLNVSYFTCAGRLREAKSIVFYVSGRLWQAKCVVFYVSGNSKRRKIIHIWSVLGTEGSRRQNQSYFTCLEGSGRLKVSYCTRLEVSGRFNLSYFTCAGRFWEAKCVVLYASGSSKRR